MGTLRNRSIWVCDDEIGRSTIWMEIMGPNEDMGGVG